MSFSMRSVPAACATAALLFSGIETGLQAATFSNPGRIQILDNTNASPYPSDIVVQGVAGRITSVTATLSSLSHSFISDVDVLLVAPSGQSVLLMAHVGEMSSASNVDLTFNDAGPALPAVGTVSSGTYRPTQFGSTPVFSAPAPSPPYGTMMSDFTNQTANGTWSLFARDHVVGDSGVIAGGWSLTIVTEGKAPEIGSLPSVTAEEGSAVCMRAGASGDPPLGYQWYFNGSDALVGGTGSALQVPDVHSTNAGTYFVVATNTFGAVTSAPAMLSVIPPVERSVAPGLLFTAEAGTDLYLEYATSLTPSPNWAQLATVTMGGIIGPGSQWYFDGLACSAGQRFYRVSHDNDGSIVPGLEFRPVPAITLRGTVGNSVWIDYINQVGPTNAWAQLATVTLTDTSQPYFDTSSVGQPPRLYRVATTFMNLDFELAMGLPGSPDFTNALPGWTGYRGSNQLSSVIYNNEYLDTAGVSIFDSGCTAESLTGVLHGRYCVCLCSGFQGPPPNYSFDVPAWIAQTARIPLGAASIVLN